MVIHAVQRAHLSHLRCKGEGQLIRAGADICRVPASTLRFCEEKGLIASIGRRGLRRLFAPGVLERLAVIALGRASAMNRCRSRPS